MKTNLPTQIYYITARRLRDGQRLDALIEAIGSEVAINMWRKHYRLPDDVGPSTVALDIALVPTPSGKNQILSKAGRLELVPN
jgi:hypothetical protein